MLFELYALSAQIILEEKQLHQLILNCYFQNKQVFVKFDVHFSQNRSLQQIQQLQA